MQYSFLGRSQKTKIILGNFVQLFNLYLIESYHITFITYMGCQNSNEVSKPSLITHPDLKGSFKQQAAAEKPTLTPALLHIYNDLSMPLPISQMRKLQPGFWDNFIIAKTIKDKLSDLTFTSAQLNEITESILALSEKLEETETQEEKKIICQIVKETSMQKLRYHHVLQAFKDKYKQIFKREDVKYESLSRIYHTIANTQKEKQVERQYKFIPQSQKNKKGYEKVKINYLQTNGYNILNSQQVEDVIKFEGIAQKIEDFSTRFKFKFESIRTQSEDMNKLLADSFTRYQSKFKGLRYDFEKQEVMKVAEISRNACNYSDNGVVVLLIYLVNACSKYEKNGQSVQVIEQLMIEFINSISKRYPPGQGLKKQQENLRDALKKLQLKEQFSNKSYPLSAQNKQMLLEQIIILNATTAKRYKSDFEELLQQTCLELSIKVIAGLKLDPDRPNQKAMIRIKEKMLIGKNQSSQAIINQTTIKETIDFEQGEYRRKVDQLVNDKNEITFKISDMLRGKCIFISIPDIILTIDKIKAFALKDEEKRFRIIEIESRFTNIVPISDVTLKIAINEDIVAELQLTVQSNTAAYNFAHKVYQLQRAKMFSKIKIVHNYFEEFGGGFKELVSKALSHAVKTTQSKDKSLEEKINKRIEAFKSKQTKEQEEWNVSLSESIWLIDRHSAAIRQYFAISANDLDQNSGESLFGRERKYSHAKRAVSTDQELQGMMLALFNKQMGSWESELGKHIDSVLQSNCSELLKATLLSFFFRSFDISKEVQNMLGWAPEYLNIARLLDYDLIEDQNFMMLYLQKIFSISRPFDLTKTTARIFYQAQQLQNIKVIKQFDGPYSRLVVDKIVKGVVIEDNDPQQVQFLLRLVSSYFTNRTVDNNFYEQFQVYYEMLMKLLSEQPSLDSGISAEAKLLKVNKLLQERGGGQKEASAMLKQIKDDFKKREEMKKWLQCELLLAETCIYGSSSTIEEFQDRYQKVVQAANAMGLELRGGTVAYSQWRIYQNIQKRKTSQEHKRLMYSHIGRAITQSSRNEDETLFFKIKAALQQGLKTEELKIIENYTVRHIKLAHKELNQDDCLILAKIRWRNLTSLNLYNNNIEAQGCAHLIKAKWKNLTSLDLRFNNIGAQGCAYLIKAEWKNLTSLSLDNNNIEAQGCANLINAEWSNLTQLDLGHNNIGNQGCAHLIKAEWKNLTSLYLDRNNIEAQGCAHLIKAEWKNLTLLSLRHNNIEAQGCVHLIKAEWKNLTSLYLDDNNINRTMRESLQKQFNNPKLQIQW